MDTRMVIVEGFPGCGKSTTAQWLARRVRTRGDRAEWFYEDQRPHPLARPTAGTYSSWREYFAERLRRWSLLANQAASSNTVTILDSAWLQVPLFVMLRQDVDRRVIRTFIRTTVDAMRSAGPALVYLSQPDPVGGMRRLFEERGMAWALLHAGRSDASRYQRNRGIRGIDGLLHYWREHNALAEAIAREPGMPALILDPHEGDWPDRRAAIARFLGLPPRTPEPPPEHGDLARLVGEYRRDATRFVIRLQGAGLVVDGLLWRGNALLPLAANVFEAQSWPLFLTFLEQDGEIRSMRIDGPVVGGRPLAGVYEKV